MYSLSMMVMVLVVVAGMMNLHNWVFLFMMMVVVMVVWVAITSSSEQWFSFFMSSNGLSYKENSLLYEKYQEESKTDNELCDWELHIYLVFCLNLRQNLGKQLLGFWNEI